MHFRSFTFNVAVPFKVIYVCDVTKSHKFFKLVATMISFSQKIISVLFDERFRYY